MVKLNLEANGQEQEKILNYLQENTSETLANKINNGVYIEKDGKRLLNKKDLNNFMQFAYDEAKKLAEKNARYACVSDDIVYGWAIHYFEEESIEGTLYNDDGTEYNKATPVKPKTTVTSTKVISKTKKNDGQVSIFDMNFSETEQDDVYDDEQDDVDEVETPPSGTRQAAVKPTSNETIIPTNTTPQGQYSQAELFYAKYEIIQKQYADSILFYRLGAFYEALGESAEKASSVLDLTLTGKNCGSLGRVPMCGIPYHAVEVYTNKLRTKYSVVLMHSDKDLQEYPKKKFEDIVQENAEKIDAIAGDELGLVIDEETNKEIDEMSVADFDKYFNNIEDYVDKTTGEIKVPNIDKELFETLYNLFDGQVVMG